MWAQILTIGWAQWRTVRNHLPRTTIGSLLSLSIAIVWYGGFATLAVFLATALPDVPVQSLRLYLGAGLLGVFLFWQLLPLLTLTGGWSLDLKKLQVYPLSTNAMLITEAILRVTTGVEMVLVLLGGCLGLMLHPRIPVLAPLALLLLFIPFNLLVSLLTREIFLHAFERTRFRELFTVLVISLGLLPQIAMRLGWSRQITHYFLLVANAAWSPWHDVAAGATVVQPGRYLLATLVWLLLAWSLAKRQFGASLREEEVLVAVAIRPDRKFSLSGILELPARCFADPLGTLIIKEIRTLPRMPRFRVVFLMAALFSVFLLIPLGVTANPGSFGGRNFLPMMSLYGLLVLADALMWNVFGFDRSAAQLYFVTPVDLRAVFRAKNIVAAFFLAIQSVLVLCFALLLKMPVTPTAAATALCASAAMGTFFISVGNMSSVIIPRAMDARATMKKQSGAGIQLWLLGCSLGTAVLVGFAYLAGWATNNPWATIAVLTVELIIGLICYRFSLDSAVEKCIAGREEILTALSKGSSMVSS
jgi:ABC-2 type transport system permease protein